MPATEGGQFRSRGKSPPVYSKAGAGYAFSGKGLALAGKNFPTSNLLGFGPPRSVCCVVCASLQTDLFSD